MENNKNKRKKEAIKIRFNQEPVIQWLSFVYVLHICFSFIFFLHK